ncbi:MAG: 2-oxoglutarate dehydrogenase complex dihydrolipoyllysine-residue succinyltransferase [Acidobacteria bacterium]|nr:2-oxoglutarate dehydrogenase complex dihydrolipoyllysine-residue succinyltransferase [Acidobacteriota bacterium]
MTVELKVPSFGESVTEALVAQWLKAEGDAVDADEPVAVLETDKVTSELPAPAAGVLAKILKKQGEMTQVGDVIAVLEEGAAPRKPAAEPAAQPAAARPAPAAQARVMPAARRALAEHGLAPADVTPTGPGGRVLKEDVEREAARRSSAAPAAAPGAAPAMARVPAAPTAPTSPRQEEVVPMSPLRKRVAERLVAAQQTAALLTTFNEVDMSSVIALRQQHREAFETKYGIKLGFMSFFVKAAIDALKLVPQVNAEVREDSIVYRNYYDIGIAVGGGRGLVVPVLRDADRMSFAEVELKIADYARRARENKLTLEELAGGTFTISNGGIYGSMLSTPIVNAPQSGILGLHAIQERPVALNGQVVVRPMMYLAMTYDHRIIDGREAVTFVKRIKECIESPTRILLEV